MLRRVRVRVRVPCLDPTWWTTEEEDEGEGGGGGVFWADEEAWGGGEEGVACGAGMVGCNERVETEQADGSEYAWESGRRRASMLPLVQMLGLVKWELDLC